MHENWMPFGWGGMGLGLALWLALVGLAIWLIVSLSRQPNNGEPRKPTAIDILDERFARGEIDNDEYEARRKSLRG